MVMSTSPVFRHRPDCTCRCDQTDKTDETRPGEAGAGEGTTEPPKKRSLHHRIYPYMDELVQYANEREDGVAWVVRDRSAALRNERQGRGRALVRLWVPTDWYPVDLPVNEVDDE